MYSKNTVIDPLKITIQDIDRIEEGTDLIFTDHEAYRIHIMLTLSD